MAALAGIIAGGDDHSTVVDIGMTLEVVGTMTGITIIEGVGLWHGLAAGAADQGDGGGSRGMAGRAGIMPLGISGVGGKYRRMAVDGAGGQHNRCWLAAIFIGADIADLVIIGMAGMAIQTGNRMLGIGQADDIGDGGVRRSDISGAAGVVAEAAIVLMLDLDIVPGGQTPVTVVMAGGAGLAGITVSAETDSVTLVAAAGAVIVTGKIARMAHGALTIGCRGAGGRAFQPAIGGQIMTGAATANGMGLACTNEGRHRGAVATKAVGGQGRRGNIGFHRCGMTMGMATKIGGMAVRAGGGGFAVPKGGTCRIKADTGDVQEITGIGPQEGGIAVAGLAGIAMNGHRVVGQMLVAVGAGRGIGQEIVGRLRRLEPLYRVMTVGAFLGGVMAIM